MSFTSSAAPGIAATDATASDAPSHAVFLDADTRTMIALGNPKTLRDESPEAKVRAFLTRGEHEAGGSR